MGATELLTRCWSAAPTPERPHPAVHLWYPLDAGAQGPATVAAAPIASAASTLGAGSGPFPLLLYLPGWAGTCIENTALLAHLAGHGYVVAGMHYPLRAGLPAEALARCLRELEAPMDYGSEAAYRETVRRATARVDARAADATALLDGFARMAESHPLLAGRLDLDRVGILGFSLGGAVAAEAATRDARFRAVVNIDGRHWNQALLEGVRQPYLFIGEELHEPTAADLAARAPERRYNAMLDRHDYAQLAKNLRRHGGIHVTVRGADHMDFTDLPRRRRLLRLLHRPAAKRTAPLLRRCTVDFFEAVFRGTRSGFLTPGSTPYRGARIEIFPAPGQRAVGGVQIW